MTSLIGWVGVDSRGPASLYLASDSRVSWRSHEVWDSARKLFAIRTTPELFGYCGSAFAPAIFLAQFASMIEAGAGEGTDSADARHDSLVRHAAEAVNGLPTGQRAPFGLVHFAREGAGMAAVFRGWWTSWDATTGWTDCELPLPTRSSMFLAKGTGKAAVEESELVWRKSEVGGTSRAVFSAFCDALRSGRDPLSGGGPQLVGLYRKGAGETFGVAYLGSRFLLGARVSASSSLQTVEWRNELFERCDPISLQLLTGAQRHARPRGVGS